MIWDAINRDALKWPPKTMAELLLEISWIHGRIEAQQEEIDRLDFAWTELEERAGSYEVERDDAELRIEKLLKRIRELEANDQKARKAACRYEAKWPPYHRGCGRTGGPDTCTPYV
jgi:chromosome segregation ATPase